MHTPTRNAEVRLTGRLVRDRIIRTTAERKHQLEERRVSDAEHEFFLPARELIFPGREYALLYVYVPRRQARGWTGEVRRVVVWNVDRGGSAIHPARLARRGDKVRIRGRRDRFTFERDGQTHTVEQVVASDLEFLQIKAPEYGADLFTLPGGSKMAHWRDEKTKRDDELIITLRRFDGAWRVLAHEPGIEHTHRARFRSRDVAERFGARVIERVTRGGSLDLEHWETHPTDECHYRHLIGRGKRIRKKVDQLRQSRS